MTSKARLGQLMVLLFIPFIISSCSDFSESKSYAEEALDDFHYDYNANNLVNIYENAHKEFKQSATEEEFIQFLGAVHRKLGPVVSSSNSGWNVNSYNLKTYVSLTQKTTFESGSGVESFTFRIKDGKATLLSYNINSKDLIIN